MNAPAIISPASRRSIALEVAETREAKRDQRTIEASVSSEEPYERWPDVKEVLEHSPAAVDMTRAEKGLALLLYHDTSKVVGIAEDFRVVGKKLRCSLRFGQSAEATSVWEDVKAGVLRHISVGYQVLNSMMDGKDTVRVTRWQPQEISLVAVPADITVGIGRSHISKESQMTTAELTAERNAGAAAERTRASEIMAMGTRFNAVELSRQHIAAGTSIEEFRQHVINHISATQQQPHANANSMGLSDLSGRDKRAAMGFSLGKAIAAHLTNDWSSAGLEREVSGELARRSGKTAQGFFVPSYAMVQRATQVASGSSIVGTDTMENAFIDALTNQAVVLQAGATRLPGLSDNVSLPRQSGTSQAAWYAENSAISESTPTLNSVSLAAKQCSGRVAYSRKLLVQSLPSIEQLMVRDLNNQIALAIDAAAIAGTGSSNQPTGILSTAGIGVYALGTNGAAPNWAMVVELMKLVGVGNAMMGRLGYISNFKVLAKLQQTPRQASGVEGNFIMGDATGKLNGFNASWSNQVPSNLTKGTSSGVCSSIIFGNWADLLIGEWGAIDVVLDPFSDAVNGNIRVHAFAFVDIAVRNAVSFAACNDVLTT